MPPTYRLGLTHSPQLNETVVSGGYDQGHGWVECLHGTSQLLTLFLSVRMQGGTYNPVDAAVMSFENKFHDGIYN